MNKLHVIKNMGFNTPWKLIALGLFGSDEIPPLTTHFDVVEFLDDMLIDVDEQIDNIVSLVCEKDDRTKFDRLLQELANQDDSDFAIQKRKWRACLLKILVDNINDDYLQGLLELMEFWVSMGVPEDCPQAFPSDNNETSLQDYFTRASYEFNLNCNQEWLKKEIKNIIELES